MKMIQILTLALALAQLPLVLGAASQTRFATLYNLTGDNPVGLVAANGVLYGVTNANVAVGFNCGTIFELQPPATGGSAWTETLLYSFSTTNFGACTPLAAPVVGANGALYGVTSFGGAYGGTVYELQPPASPGGAWTETVIYNFTAPGSITAFPVSGLVVGPNGSFYVLAAGDIYGGGALVQLLPPASPGGTWTANVVYNSAPASPPDSLTTGANGVLYGTTVFGGTGTGGLGQVFQLTPPSTPGGTWTETVLYNLGRGDGTSPNSLTFASDGTLYGTTYGLNAFTSGNGTVFQMITPTVPGGSWTYTVLQDFGQRYPSSPLILRNGNLYGTVASPMGGEAFELQRPAMPGGAWTLTYLHHFAVGEIPGGALVMDHGGTIYGVTAAAVGELPAGTVYRIAP